MIGQEFKLVFGIRDAIYKRFIDPVSTFEKMRPDLDRSLYLKDAYPFTEEVETPSGDAEVKLTQIIIHGKLDPVPGYGDRIEHHEQFVREVFTRHQFYEEDVPRIDSRVLGSDAMHRDIKNHMENTTGGWTMTWHKTKEEVD